MLRAAAISGSPAYFCFKGRRRPCSWVLSVFLPYTESQTKVKLIAVTQRAQRIICLGFRSAARARIKFPRARPMLDSRCHSRDLFRLIQSGYSQPCFRMAFLEQYERRPFALPDVWNWEPVGLYLGKGPNAAEVAVVNSGARPTIAALRAAWKARLGGRATPLIV